MQKSTWRQIRQMIDEWESCSVRLDPATQEATLSWQHGRWGSEYRWTRGDEKSYRDVLHDIAADAGRLGLISYYEAALLTAWVRNLELVGIIQESSDVA